MILGGFLKWDCSPESGSVCVQMCVSLCVCEQILYTHLYIIYKCISIFSVWCEFVGVSQADQMAI